MLRKKKTDIVDSQPDESSPTETLNSVNLTETEPTRYVVVRDDKRVSDNDYSNPDDTHAIAEHGFWERLVDNWSPGEKVEIVKFNKKRHRNW